MLRAGTRTAVMDVGPLGYLSIAAHGHADALSVTLSIDGQDVIGDPGAGSYYGHPDWRRINRGTRVHASVEVDGHDQSVIGGPFMWTHHAQVRVRAVDLESGVVDAEHFGYRRFAEPVTHRRWLVAPHDCAALLVVDLLSGTGRHLVRTSWPLHPSLDVERLLARTPRDAKRISDRSHRGCSYHATHRRAGAWRRTQPLGVVVESAGITRTVMACRVVLRGGSTAGGCDRHPAGGGRPKGDRPWSISSGFRDRGGVE